MAKSKSDPRLPHVEPMTYCKDCEFSTFKPNDVGAIGGNCKYPIPDLPVLPISVTNPPQITKSTIWPMMGENCKCFKARE